MNDAKRKSSAVSRRVRATGRLLLLLATAGCAAVGCVPAPGPAESGATRDPSAVKPPEASVPRQTETAAAPPAVPAAAPETAPKPAPPGVRPPVAGDAPAPVAKAPARTQPAPGAPAPKKEAVAAAPAKPPAAPPLDLASLEKRLKETDAIGVLTKLTLKNQVDDLLERFKAYYAGNSKATLTELRQRFDLLVIKVLSLLQDRDAPLAAALSASREALWDILSDPVKFRSVVARDAGQTV